MEEIQKKTTKATTTKKRETTTKPKTTEKKSTTKTAKEVAVKETTKTVKKTATKKAVDIEKKVTEKKPVKSEKKVEEKKTTKTVKKETESKPTKAAKEPATKRTTNTAKKVTERKPTKTVEKAEEIKKIEVKEEPKKQEKTAKKTVEKKTSKPKTEIKQEKVIEPKNKEVETKKEEKDKDKETKKNKYVYISIGTIACIVIILGLILLNIKLGMHAYDIIKGDKTTNSELEAGEKENGDSSTAQEIGNVLKNDNEIAKKAIGKITFSPSTTATIYAEGKFNIDSISNALKLKIGWEKTEEERKLRSINENNEEVVAIEKTTMDQTIEEVFGPNTKTKSESFDYAKVKTFEPNVERVAYSEGMYTSVIKSGEGEKSPFIYQEVQKVVKYSDKIVIYAKSVYINIEDGKYIAYKKFEDGNFDEKLVELTSEELFGDVIFNNKTGEGTISLESNPSLDSIRNKLDTYKYTLSIDTTTQEYHLNEFCKEATGV